MAHIEDETLQGKIKWYNQVEGFGFVTLEGGQDVYFQKIDMIEAVDQGDSVEFELMTGVHGLCATQVRKAAPTTMNAA